MTINRTSIKVSKYNILLRLRKELVPTDKSVVSNHQNFLVENIGDFYTGWEAGLLSAGKYHWLLMPVVLRFPTMNM